jgi:hypothetical protein
MTYEWLEAARRRLADEVGDDPRLYELDERQIEMLLDLARVAAHEGGHKTNAPLLSYLVGLAHGRNPGRTLDELVSVATSERGQVRAGGPGESS